MGRTRARAPLAGTALLLSVLTACSGTSTAHRSDPTPTPVTTTAAPASGATSAVQSSTARTTPSIVATKPATHHPKTRSSVHAHKAPRRTAPHSAPPTTPTRTHAPSAAALPLRLPTYDATQLITVVAPGTGSTTATLRAWQRSGGQWQPVGPSVPAWLGSAGMTAHPSESTSATPMGSFTLTEAFGHDPDPGTALPYTHTTPDDWWISEPGPLYNTRQRCASGCAFTRGDPNEHLYFETPYYDYALVIDYNTRNAPGGVRQGAGSAFFLHVSVGAPTAGCVSVAADEVVRLLRWLRPQAHPRILIGTG